jgi:hypothetical protein
MTEYIIIFAIWYAIGLLSVPLSIIYWTSPKRSIPMDFTRQNLWFFLFYAWFGPFALVVALVANAIDLLPPSIRDDGILFKARRK